MKTAECSVETKYQKWTETLSTAGYSWRSLRSLDWLKQKQLKQKLIDWTNEHWWPLITIKYIYLVAKHFAVTYLWNWHPNLLFVWLFTTVKYTLGQYCGLGGSFLAERPEVLLCNIMPCLGKLRWPLQASAVKKKLVWIVIKLLAVFWHHARAYSSDQLKDVHILTYAHAAVIDLKSSSWSEMGCWLPHISAT